MPAVVEENYPASPEQAWSLLGDFEGIDKTFAAVEDVSIDGDDRTFTMMGMRITERLVERDEQARRLTYSIVSGIPVEFHRATIEVLDGENGGCSVRWTVEATPEEAIPLFADTYASALGQLKSTLGG